MKSILIIFLFFTGFGYSQNTGLYGKKSVVEFQLFGNVPLLSNWLDYRVFYKASGDQLEQGRNLLDYGIRFGAMRAFTNQFGLGLEFTLERQRIAAPNSVELEFDSWFGSFTDMVNVNHEFIRLNTMSILPKFEFSRASNLLPIGLSHHVGIGYTRTTIVERDYVYNVILNSNYTPTTDINSGLINYSNVITGFLVMYQLNMRTPITQRLMINYGIRYTANFVRRTNVMNPEPGEFDMFEPVKIKRNSSLIQLNFGMGFAF